MSLELAEHVARSARRGAERRGVAVCVAVLDHAGDLVHLARMDGVVPASVPASQAKASTARLFAARTAEIVDYPVSVLSAVPGVTLMGGGVLLRQGEAIVGSLGVSGASEAEDVLIADEAAAGIQAQA